ncbi:mannosyltransferase [Allorhizobium sp. BGMRC 0089]|uniref:glycosyltransferase n=1 Tax=Allorhizobium sonneratiae TaxID=2934936 RepID=UPI0020333A3B|nr:glycosyltransferase [Allorhizobium sonneratiae]MCM2290715.1 mannosyltransferase [Allorhizobium sonneratiae]
MDQTEKQPRTQSRERLKNALQLAQNGDITAARHELETLANDKDALAAGDLGPLTAHGLPRKLHSAFLKLAKIEKATLTILGLQQTAVPPPALLLPFSRFSAEEHRTITALNRQPVPRLLHQIWLGALPVPAACAAWADHAARHGLTYRLWREADLAAEGFDSDASFQAMLAEGDYPGAVDAARYRILERHGGIYLDCDFYPARDDLSFADLLPLIGLTAMAEDIARKTGLGSLLLANSFIATPPGHPVFTRMLEAMPQAMALLPKGPAWWTTGPLLFSVVARGASLSLAGGHFLAASLARKAPFTAVEAARAQARNSDGGLLILWKSW